MGSTQECSSPPQDNNLDMDVENKIRMPMVHDQRHLLSSTIELSTSMTRLAASSQGYIVSHQRQLDSSIGFTHQHEHSN